MLQDLTFSRRIPCIAMNPFVNNNIVDEEESDCFILLFSALVIILFYSYSYSCIQTDPN